MRQLAGWLVALLLAAQWATASYACPRLTPGDMAATPMLEMPGCNGSAHSMDPEQPQLCKAHCEQGALAVTQPVPSDPPAPMPVVWAVLDWHAHALQPPPSAIAGVLHPPPPDRPSATPIYLAFRILRN